MINPFTRVTTDKAYLENEECLKSVAPPPTAYYVHTIRSYWVSIGSLDECIWRHQSDFQISTFNAHKHPQTCGCGVSGNQSSRLKLKNPLGGAICILIWN